MVGPGTILGPMKDDLCEELGIKDVHVVSGTGHDTACAVVAQFPPMKAILSFFPAGPGRSWAQSLPNRSLMKKAQNIM